MVAIFFVRNGVPFPTYLLARGSGTFARTRQARSIHVMFARSYFIRLATLTSAKLATRHNSMAHPVTPSGTGISTITPHTTSVTTRHQILRRKMEVALTSRVNTDSIRHRLNRPKRPTRPARPLISNLSYRRTVRPLLTRVELVRHLDLLQVVLWRQDRQTVLVIIRQDAHQASDVARRRSFVKVTARFPRRLLIVDMSYCLVGQKMVPVEVGYRRRASQRTAADQK